MLETMEDFFVTTVGEIADESEIFTDTTDLYNQGSVINQGYVIAVPGPSLG